MRRLIALLCLCACSDPQITGSASELAVEPAELVFALTWVGHPTELPLALVNRGRSPQGLTTTVEGPFQLSEIPTELTGAARREVRVRFVPEVAGELEGAIRIVHEGGTVTVPLRGTAEVPPVCGDSECHTGVFDPAIGACRQVQLADGTACANPCLEASTCEEGRCVGKPKSCDDDNVCTVDTCDPVSGCRHVDATAQCPKPSNPCRVAVCEPESGCGEEDAADYTPCGSVSCAAANVCFSGACMEFDPPEGFPCAAATPCQDVGVCKAKKCERPAPGPLAVAWTYAPAEKHYAALADLVDADGNLYLRVWPSATASRCESLYPGSRQDIDRCNADRTAGRHRIVSLTPGGEVRWVQELTGTIAFNFTDHGRLWVLVGDQTQVRDTADGSLVATLQSRAGHTFHVGDRIVLARRWLPSSGDIELFAYDALTAAPLWEVRLSSTGDDLFFGEPALLEGDNTMMVVRRSLNQQSSYELFFLDPAGNELSRTALGEESLTLLALPSRNLPVFRAGASWLTPFDARSGKFRWKVDYLDGGSSTGASVGADRVFVSTIDNNPGTAFAQRLSARRLTDGGEDWSTTLSSVGLVLELWLTARGSVVVAQDGLSWSLAEVRTADGAELYTCPVPRFEEFVAIGHGHAYVNVGGAVKAYSLPNLELAKRGWISRDGNPGRSNRPW